MPEVMEVQILDAEDAARSGKRRTDALGIKREDVLGLARLSFDDCPGLGGVLEAAVIAFLVPRMLRIPNQAGPTAFVVVRPFQAGDLRLSPRRGDGEVHDRQHGDIRASVARGEVVAQPREFLRRRPPRALARLADQTQRCARFARLLRDLRAHCLLRCHWEIVSKVWMCQRISAASVKGSWCLRPGTAWFSSCTSGYLAQLAAAERCAKVRYSCRISVRPLRMRMIAV
jgi:hypothetical protein